MAGWELCTSRSNSSSPTNSAGLSPSRTTARSSKSWTATGPATPRGRLASPSDERSLRFIALCAAADDLVNALDGRGREELLARFDTDACRHVLDDDDAAVNFDGVRDAWVGDTVVPAFAHVFSGRN